jgi:coenzyme F420-reducing hydrogenase delta subunit/Pyruvate/2-oxoacid:ferredoxin oxidoreductase delta subunit
MIPLREFQKRARVLVAGGGLTALETAFQVAELGYEVVLASPVDAVQPVESLQSSDQALGNYENELLKRLKRHPKGRILEGAPVKAISGFAGDFRVELDIGGQRRDEAVGAVVLAPELLSRESASSVPSGEAGQRLTLDQMVKAFLYPAEAPAAFRLLRPDTHVAFVIGLNGSGDLSEMAQALNGALKIREAIGSRVYFFTGNVKVAGEGLERLYLACREAGVVFFKFGENQPDFVIREEQPAIQFVDPLVGLPLELRPDLLIAESGQALPDEIRVLAAEAHLGSDRSGFLQPPNVHLLPHQSLREGIFIAGPAKGPLLPLYEIEEARGAALAVHHFFIGREADPQTREVSVDKGLCTICLTCLRFCPHQAIGWDHRVFIHPLACRRCGICASECPMDAIQVEGYSDSEVENRLASIAAGWEKESAGEPKFVVFGCQRSAGTAWEEARGAGRGAQGEKNGSVEFVGLPCAGKLDPDFLLKALSLGADGVLVLACPEENCRSNHGNTYARDRLAEARDYLEEAGIDGRRLRFENISSNRVCLLNEVLQDFTNVIIGLEGQATEEHENRP